MKDILKKIFNNGTIITEKGIGFDQVRKRLERALLDLKNAKIIMKSDKEGAYRIAYDSMLQAGIAIILYHGYRPKVKNFHKTVVDCSKQILGNEYYALVKQFDQMRRNRHELIYDIGIVSQDEAIESIKVAEKFIKEIILYIKKNSPQQELDL